MREMVKKALRITASAFDDEVDLLIASARADLIRVGVSSVLAEKDDDPLVATAIIWFCKARFGFDNPEAERMEKIYEMCRAELALSTGYKEEKTP